MPIDVINLTLLFERVSKNDVLLRGFLCVTIVMETTTRNVNQRFVPAEDSPRNLLSHPHSVLFRLFHGTSFLFATLLLVAASCMYFTRVIANVSNAYEIGAWLYIAASLCFLLANLQDWSYHRIGLLIAVKKNSRRFRCTTIDMNYFASMAGSSMYLIGSVFFLPKYADLSVVGVALFIAASIVICLAEGWKIARLACTNDVDVNDHRFHVANVRGKLQCIFISFAAVLGGVIYLVGSILSLPRYVTTDWGEDRAAGILTAGGVFFILAALLLQYYYYGRRRE